MEQELVSVIVPVYNAEQYLDECFDSLVNQTYHALEIILVDDGSTDSSPARCDALKEKDPRVRVIHKANGGPSDVRNTGIRESHGRYIVFIDSDDIVSYCLIEQLVKHHNQKAGCVVGCGLQRFHTSPDQAMLNTSNGACVKVSKSEYFSKRGGYFSVAMLYDAADLKDSQVAFDTALRNLEDVVFLSCLFPFLDTVYYIDEPLYFYRVNPESITSKASNTEWQVRSWVAAYSSLLNAAVGKKLQPDVRKELRQRYRMCLNNIYGELFAKHKSYSDFKSWCLESLQGLKQEPLLERMLHKYCPWFEFYLYKMLLSLRR